MHLNDGQLRASLDQELPEEETRHLAGCALCRNRLADIQHNQEQAGRALSFLAGGAEDVRVPAASYELTRLKNRVAEKEIKMQGIFKVLKNKLVWGSAATVMLVAAFLSVPTMQAAAARLLALFRVQQVTALPVDPTGLTKLNGDENLSSKLSQVISDQVVETKKPGDPREVSDKEQASQEAGFAVRLPGSESAAPALYIQDAAAYEINIDRAKAQTFIDETGRTDIVLPESIDGQQVKVNIPAGVEAAYGVCPKPGEKAKGDPDEISTLRNAYPDCVMMAQIPSPEVSAPDDLNISQLVELGLEFTGMSTEEAQQVSQSIDWTSTLVIPIPRNAASYEKVDVDGVSGTLIQEPVDQIPHYLLVWVKDGIIYSIGGWGSDGTRALEMANSLQ